MTIQELQQQYPPEKVCSYIQSCFEYIQNIILNTDITILIGGVFIIAFIIAFCIVISDER